MKDQRIKILRDLPVGKSIVKMAIPSILGMQVAAFYNIIDTMFVSWLGTEATGTTQVLLPIIMIISAISLTFGIGGGSYISRLLGEDKFEEANQITTICCYLALCLGIISTVLGIVYIEPLLKFFGASPKLMPYSLDYGYYIILGTTPQMINLTLNNILRSEGSSKIPMIGMIAGAILNLILDPILIFKLDLGIKGAAIATTISQFVTLGFLASQYILKKTLLTMRLKRPQDLRRSLVEIFKIGLPTFARQVLSGFSITFLNQAALSYGGTDGLAAIGIVIRTMMVVIYVILGLSQGFQPVAGFSYGAQNYKRLKDALDFTFIISLGTALGFSIIYLYGCSKILMIYKPTPQVMKMAIDFSYYYVLSLLLMSFSNVLSVYYQAVGRSWPALILAISRQGIFFIPFIWILPLYFSMDGVFMAQPLADFFTLLISLFLFKPTRQTLNQAIAKSL